MELDIYKTLIKNTSGHLYWKNKDSVYLGCNQNMAVTCGFKDQEGIVGKTDLDLLNDANLALKIVENDQEVIMTGEEQIFEETARDSNNNLAYYITRKAPLYSAEDEIIGVMGFSTNITEQKKAQAIKEEFLDNISHDLRTPFCGVMGATEILFNKETDPVTKEYIGYILDSTKVLLKIVNQVIEIITLKHFTVFTEPFGLKEMLEEVLVLLQPLKPENVNVIIDCPDCVIVTERLKLFRIFSALIGNAIKFTPAGLISVRIKIEANTLFAEIEDNGKGIAESNLENIFDLFYKETPSYKTGEFNGMGSGLYVAKNFAESLHGNVWVKSNLGVGSIFGLSIPLG